MNRSTSDDSEATSASDLFLSRFKDAKAWPAIVVAAVVLLLTFTTPLPWLLVRAIAENRPTGSLEDPLVTHDLDDKVYARLVARDPSQLRCPYRSLYAGFEQKWSYYKVLQLLVKLALALVIVLAATADDRIRGILSCAIYVTVVAISSYGTPFSDPFNNVMEISGKITALTTCVGGALAAFIDMKQAKSVVHIVNFFVMLVVLLLGMKGARLFLKNLLGWITFSDTSRGLEDAPAKNVLPRWDVDKEAKHRVWQAFWRSILLELTQNISKFKENTGELTVVHRLEALEQAVVASGARRVRSHWTGEEHPYTSKLRQATRSALEGVDVFWDDASGARDGHLDSKSFFGKMYVLPYPFHCVMVYDDSKDEAVIRDEAVAPHTGKVHHLQNRVASMGPDHIGLSSTMDESEQLHTIFEQTKDVKHADANATLSDAFWYFVYNNPHISRQELEFHLKHREGNPQLQSLTETHQSALDSLYLRIKFIHSHPAVTFWFVFWDDVYARNGEMKGIRKCKADFEPLQPTAICYHVMRRPDLESWLCKRRLVGNRRLFHSRLLDLLYSQMNKRLENKNA
ncbi:hypothetical protein JG688_00012570 [Phytophthora aleatoria]|uniref:Uncharacterized protein n=1 Tax=Phytophthora aleatoria TaxID=2496075 RepID=A0A8J5M1V7_9STRA|nr:hypothetical protein JG688_00012570 [Phytophthora aleatoria]